ncbi:MAG: peptidase S9 [Planctomycetes bacterium RBG_16_64_10]|nr:MAG: peptidase S9 [Planctomycetes bacterium RBG_16_64_10]
MNRHPAPRGTFAMDMFAWIAATLPITAASASAGPPATAQRPITDCYHGRTVIDNYRWLEDGQDHAVRRWSDEQNAHARSVLDQLPQASALRVRVTEILAARTASYDDLVARPGCLFAMLRQPPQQQRLLVVLPSADAPDRARVLVDPNGLDPDGTTAIDWFAVSLDGQLVAVSLSRGGSESGDVHIYQVKTGAPIGEVVPRVNGGTAGGDVAWAADGSGFYYTRYPRAGERPPADLGFYQQVYFHQLGTPTEQDRYEIGRQFPRIAEIQLEVDPRSGRLLATVQDGDGGQFAHYVRSPHGDWRQFSRFGDQIVQATFGPNDDLYLVSRAGAPRGKILRLAIAALDGAAAETVVPEGKDAIVTSFAEVPTVVATASRIYVTYQLGGPTEIRVFDHHGKPLPGPRQLPVSSVGGLTVLGDETVLFGSESFIEPAAYYHYDAATHVTGKTALATQIPVDFSDVEVVRELAISPDGTKVPLNVILRKGTKRDGANPCLVTAYGGYGVSMVPRCAPVRRVLLDAGVVVVVANLRGGGEYGAAWHRQGSLVNKQNVFDDFAAVIRHLIERRYTVPAKLAIIGGSNGGLLMGATMTQHPDLATAVVSLVGIYDMLRVEQSPNGAFNVTEFGTVKNRDQFEALYAYSPYHHVQDGTRYPATLLLTGANDPRVDPMQSRKMAARLQAGTSSAAPILLRTSGSTGHGGDTPLAERINETVDVYAFLFDQLGLSAAAATERANAE